MHGHIYHEAAMKGAIYLFTNLYGNYFCFSVCLTFCTLRNKIIDVFLPGMIGTLPSIEIDLGK